MLAGYNTNISYKCDTYHIQTEDSGVKNPVIVTLLYSKGAIITSKKTSYAHIVNDQDYKEKIKGLMKQQHKTMIKELLSGMNSSLSIVLCVINNKGLKPLVSKNGMNFHPKANDF